MILEVDYDIFSVVIIIIDSIECLYSTKGNGSAIRLDRFS